MTMNQSKVSEPNVSKEKGRESGVKRMMAAMLDQGRVDGLLVPLAQPGGNTVMPALITSARDLDRAVLLGPSFFVNTARMAARLSFKPSGRKTAVWMRPCEIRAFRELVKLNQASDAELLILGTDCPMALDREDWQTWVAEHGTDAEDWADKVFPDPPASGLGVSGTCRTCRAPFPEHGDVHCLFYGEEKDGVVTTGSPKGEEMLALLETAPGEACAGRETVTAELVRSGQQAFDQMAVETTAATDSLAKLDTFFSACINCYNCRTVCPLCYCRECVFNTDVFIHEPVQYHQWADRHGSLRLPSDTLFFHITRLAHMGHACVGCGQCSRACPSSIPVADLFSSVGRVIQEAFEYVPGGEDPPPFTAFKTDEFPDAVGIE